MRRPVIFQRFSTRADAETARSALLAMGVEAVVSADDVGQQYPGLSFTRGVDLLVEQDQVEDAKAVLTSTRRRMTGRRG